MIFILCGIFISIFVFSISYIKFGKGRVLFQKHVVITGGSQGIGKSAGIEAARRGAHVTILARNEIVLKAAQNEIKQNCINDDQVINAMKLDVTKFDEIEDVIKKIEETRPIDVLLNCAGMAICGTIENTTKEDVINLVNLNLLGTYFVTQAVVPYMKKRNDGVIILTASQAALLGIYGYSIYSATKFALRGLAESILMELRIHNISVTVALPPDTDTPGFERENIGKPIETLLISESGGIYKPDIVAKAILDDALAGKFYSSIGLESFMLTTLSCGMTPVSSYFDLLIQVGFLGIFRLIGAYFTYRFERIVLVCKLNREKNANKDK